MMPARGNTAPLALIKALVSRATVVLTKTLFLFAALMFANQAWAFPMKPDVKALIREAKQPPQHFVPARAGWNGPEESAAASSLNPTYEALRREPTPAERRAQLVAAMTPDWRVCAGILIFIGLLRTFKLKQTKGRKARPATILAFPAAVISKPAEISEAA